MPGIEAKQTKQRRLAYTALFGVVLLVLSELLLADLSHFWINHPMIAAIIAFTLSVALTAFVVEEVRGQQEAMRWSTVSGIAQRRLSGAAFRACAGILQGTGWKEAGEQLNEAVDRFTETKKRPGWEAPALLPEGYEENLAEALKDGDYRENLAEAIEPLTRELDAAMAQWAPIMLSTPGLAERLETFSLLRECVGGLTGYLRRYDDSSYEETMFWSTLRAFLLLYATFDALRREATSESQANLFGETADDHDRAWGLPFKAQRWLWERKAGRDLAKT